MSDSSKKNKPSFEPLEFMPPISNHKDDGEGLSGSIGKPSKSKGILRSMVDNPMKTMAGGALIGLGFFVSTRVKIAKPSEYIVKTGIGIEKVSISKKTVQWPFQTSKTISVQPSNFTIGLQAMSKEKLDFILPGVYTIGPKDDEEKLKVYATLLSNTTEDEMSHIIKGIVEGETRVLTASLSLEEIFSGRDQFRHNVTERINKELETLGLWIHNANIQEMSDHAGSEYFQFLRQRARANAENDARINIADAKKRGDVEVKEREKETRIKTAEFESQAIMYENDRQVEISQSSANMQVKQAEYTKLSEIARIESEQAAHLRASELQKDVETKRILEKQERLRSELFVQAKVEAEAKERTADADLYLKKAEAAGVNALFVAQADGLQKLFETTSDPNTVMQYLLIDRKVLPELAKANAEAIKGLQPKISYWNTGGGGAAAGGNPITDLMKNLPPLVDTIYTQTGIKPPSWLLNCDQMNQKKVD